MLTTKKPSQFSPLALAYIGDGVYELFVRTRIIEEHENLPANKLHKKTVQYVKAHAQSNSIDAMLEHMTDDETRKKRKIEYSAEKCKYDGIPQSNGI